MEATNTLIDPAYLRRGPFKDVASVHIAVQDAPEPPAFTQTAYHLVVPENKAPGTLVGQVSATDLDSPASLIRYSILPHSDAERCFSIEPEDGTIRTAMPLDREARVWHNLTVLATELGEESWAPRRPWRRQQPPDRGAGPERGGGEGRVLPSDPHQCAGSRLDHHHQAGLLS